MPAKEEMNLLRPWRQLGQPPPGELEDARLQLHYAAQVISAVGFSFVEARPDFSHTNMGWVDGLGALASHAAPGAAPFRAALRMADLTLLLLGENDEIEHNCSLGGRRLEEAYAWLAASIHSLTGVPLVQTMVRPNHELPGHPVAQGESFSLQSSDAFAELARWYGNADLVLGEVESRNPQASAVRCWPHHFDIATLIQLNEAKDEESARTIGLGMTPGDDSYAEPYWYVTPWPYPENPELPSLGGRGQWHTEGWLGAVLPASRLVDAAGAEAQAAQVRSFLQSAEAACRALRPD